MRFVTARRSRTGRCPAPWVACASGSPATTDGDRQMVEILTAVLADGLAAVEAACAEALAGGVCSADVVLNILNRRRQPSETAPIPTPANRFEPVADCTRYDRLRGVGHGAP